MNNYPQSYQSLLAGTGRCVYSCIDTYLINNFLLSIYYVTGTVLRAGSIKVNKTGTVRICMECTV